MMASVRITVGLYARRGVRDAARFPCRERCAWDAPHNAQERWAVASLQHVYRFAVFIDGYEHYLGLGDVDV